MKIKFLILTLITTLLLLVWSPVTNESKGQVMRDILINTGTGTLTGASLGGAVMLLNNDGNWAPMRVGVGTGTLFGVGIGFYDAYHIPRDDDYYIDAFFSSGSHRGSIILMDTFYGAATGALVGSAIGLISGTGSEILDGLRVGTATGAFIGASFGVFDAFIIGEPVPFDQYFNEYMGAAPSTSGIFSVDLNGTSTVEFIEPKLITYPEAGNPFRINSQLAVQIGKWSVRF